MVARELAKIISILASILLIEGNNSTTEWTTWSSCSESCYQGTRYRIRICKSSDKNCTSSHIKPCNTNACNRTNTAFTETTCNATCNNTGWLIRERYCLDPTKPLNKSCATPAHFHCTGSCDATTGSTTYIVTTTAGPGDDGNMTTWIAVGASAGFVVLLIAVVLICVCYKRKQRKDPPKEADRQYENGTNMQTLNREEEPAMIEEAYGETYQATETTTFTNEPPVTNTTQHNEQDLYARPKKPRNIRKEKNEDAYNELHGKSSVKAQDCDTTDHFNQTMSSPHTTFTSEVAYNEIDERNYPAENSGQVSDENEYEIMAGQATAYSMLETEREDKNESEYNRLQHPTVAAAYDITE